MHLDSGVLLRQTECGLVRLATGQQQPQQQQEQPFFIICYCLASNWMHNRIAGGQESEW